MPVSLSQMSTKGPRDQDAAASGSELRHDGRGEDGEGAVQGPTTSLQLGSDVQVPEGMLAPLFQDLGPEGTSGVL